MSYQAGDYVKVEFRDEHIEESEWMWLKVSSCDDALRVVFGQLDSEPVVMTGLTLGSELAVSYGNIRDHRTLQSFRPT
jgi:hypothetical protein